MIPGPYLVWGTEATFALPAGAHSHVASPEASLALEQGINPYIVPPRLRQNRRSPDKS